MGFADPYNTPEGDAGRHRDEKIPLGVDYEKILQGQLTLIPTPKRLDEIAKDHAQAIAGGMFFTTPASFDSIVTRLNVIQNERNQHFAALLK